MESGKLKVWQIIVICFLVVLLSVISIFVGIIENKLSKINYTEENINLHGLSDDVDTGELFRDSVVNILLLGTDERSNKFESDARADSIMIASLNLATKKISLCSLERGIAVPIKGMEDDWLTHTFAYGGAELLLNTVREQFDLDISYYVRVNFTTFEKIIDAVGGVEVKLTIDELLALKELTSQELQRGNNLLTGETALHYSRLRSIDDDFHRIERQRKVIVSGLEKLKSMSIFQALDFMNEVLPLVQTNLTQGEVKALALKGYPYLGSPIEQTTIPNESEMLPGTWTDDGRILTRIDFEKASRRLHKFIYGKEKTPLGMSGV